MADINKNRTVNEAPFVKQARQVHDENLVSTQATNERIANLHKPGSGPKVTVSPANSPKPQGFKVNIAG